jgi:hypothetical protein
MCTSFSSFFLVVAVKEKDEVEKEVVGSEPFPIRQLRRNTAASRWCGLITPRVRVRDRVEVRDKVEVRDGVEIRVRVSIRVNMKVRHRVSK